MSDNTRIHHKVKQESQLSTHRPAINVGVHYDNNNNNYYYYIYKKRRISVLCIYTAPRRFSS